MLVRRVGQALVEWWILAQSNWLITNGASSYPLTAAMVGLGPRGAMERYNVNRSGRTVARRDWEKNACTVVFAANPAHSETCPNNVDFAKLTDQI